jgi:hypothetical protein
MKRFFRVLPPFIASIFLLAFAFEAIGYSQIQHPKVIYTYPTANAQFVSTKSSIGVRFNEDLLLSLIPEHIFSVMGSMTGVHTGNVKLSTNNQTLIFLPDKEFQCQEAVDVTIGSFMTPSGDMTEEYHLRFTINPVQSEAKPISAPLETGIRSVGNTPEGSDSGAHMPPHFIVTQKNDPAPGQIYLSTYKTVFNQGNTHMMVIDNDGNTLFQRNTDTNYTMDFRPQLNGLSTYYDANSYKYYSMDSRYYIVLDSFEAGNGYVADGHDFHLLPGGGYVMFAIQLLPYDMSNIVDGGDSNAVLAAFIIQEFDHGKNLIFEWRSIDHFQVTDATFELLSAMYIDFAHCNSIEPEGDTAYIVSSRNMDEVTKIDRRTGEMIWRMGGKNNQFTFINDSVKISHQHTVRRLPNGNLIMLDNGNFRQSIVPYSRAVEYSVDEINKVVTKVWEYRHKPDFYSSSMGNVERLDNGNTIIAWGLCDSALLTEVKPDGSTALEIVMKDGISPSYSYRVLKYRKDQLDANSGVSLPSQSFLMVQNYPNPFTTGTEIDFRVGDCSMTRLSVYDALGNEVKILFNGNLCAGEYSARFDAKNLRSGIYFFQLSTASGTVTRRGTLLR